MQDKIKTESLDYFRGMVETSINTFVEMAKMAEAGAIDWPELKEDEEYQRMQYMLDCGETYQKDT